MPYSRPNYGKPLLERIAPDGVWNRAAFLRALPIVLFIVLIADTMLNTLRTGSMAGKFTLFWLLSLFFSFVFAMLGGRAAGVFGRLLVPTGTTTPYQRDFSFEKSLVAQGRIDEALEAFEEQIRASPTDAVAYMEAAELNAASGSAARAVELFRQMRLIGDIAASQRMHATNRLIDLYSRGETSNDGKARSELAYLIAHFPDTIPAARARELLAAQINLPQGPSKNASG
jgi:hypothetical protein